MLVLRHHRETVKSFYFLLLWISIFRFAELRMQESMWASPSICSFFRKALAQTESSMYYLDPGTTDSPYTTVMVPPSLVPLVLVPPPAMPFTCFSSDNPPLMHQLLSLCSSWTVNPLPTPGAHLTLGAVLTWEVSSLGFDHVHMNILFTRLQVIPGHRQCLRLCICRI